MIDNIFKVKNYLLNHYPLFLLILVLISYGQLLFMQPWQEDNVIFFKVAHINEPAGYLGEGIWGSGVYRHIITPYYFLYTLVGYNIPLFYTLAFTFFFLATVSVYYLFKNLINDTVGKIASFLFGSGYIAYDGFVRIYNSISSSLGIIFLSCLMISYWRYFQNKRVIYYLAAVIFYYLTVELSYIRAHYLIIPLIVFEFIFFCAKVNLKKIIGSILRLLPFLFIFYKLYIVAGDSRKESTVVLVKSLFEGHLENTFSFFVTVGNLVIPDKIQSIFLAATNPRVVSSQVLILGFFLLVAYLLIKNKHKFKLTLSIVAVLGLVWLIVSKYFFTKPTLVYSSPETVLAGFIGGLAIILVAILTVSLSSIPRKLIIFFSILMIANIAAYAAYTPTTPYGSGYRYMVHSVIGLIGIFGVLLRRLHKRYLYLAVFWGVSLLYLGVTNMHYIIEEKSNRIELFYKQLKSQVDQFPKGSVILFDIEDSKEAQSWYAVSFSVAEMPNTTAIAWRYGIDRYDIKMFTEFSDLLTEIKTDSVPLSKVYTFRVTKNGLFDTSAEFRHLAEHSSEVNYSFEEVPLKSSPEFEKGEVTKIAQKDILVDFPSVIKSLIPIQLQLSIRALPVEPDVTFPAQFGEIKNPIYKSQEFRQLALDYKKEKERFLKESTYAVSSSWKENVVSKISDNDKQSFWQADRILWGSDKANIILDLKQEFELSSLVWVNGISNNTPTVYSIDTSIDAVNWIKVSSVQSKQRLVSKQLKVVPLNPTKVRFIRMQIKETLSGDSPAIAEIWPVSSKFANLNLEEFEDFYNKPFNYIVDVNDYYQTLTNLEKIGSVKIYWLGDKSPYWQSTTGSVIKIVYDGSSRQYFIDIPPQGTEIKNLKISDFTIPGEFIIERIKVSGQGL